MRILIITDSLGLPSRYVNMDDMWVYKIIKEFKQHEFITIQRGGLSTRDLYYKTIKHMNVDLIITQIGIVDCCRRPCFKIISDTLFELLKNYKILKVIKRNMYKLTRLYDYKYVNKSGFDINVGKINKLAKKVYFIKIAGPGISLKNKIFNVENDIKDYNNILKKFNLIDPYKNKKDYLIVEDGHHLNKKGQNLVYNEVKKKLFS